MNVEMNNLLESMLTSIEDFKYIDSDSIPNIGLYVDQVTTFMDEQLKSGKRYEDDKILTKTMINNYAKNHLLPPPVKKKYSKNHVLIMIFIYYFKSVLSIKDIETVLAPITDTYFDGDASIHIEDIYKEVCSDAMERKTSLENDISEIYNLAQTTFEDKEELSEQDRESLQLFALLCSLCVDVYLKKSLIERIIDQLPEPEKNKKKK